MGRGVWEGTQAAQAGLRGGWKRGAKSKAGHRELRGVALCIADLDPPAETSRSRSNTASLVSLDIMDYSLQVGQGEVGGCRI